MKRRTDDGRSTRVRSVNDPGKPVPWYQLDPWDHVRSVPGNDEEEDALPELPPILGPADSSGTVPPSPFDISGPGGAYPPASLALAHELNWKTE